MTYLREFSKDINNVFDYGSTPFNTIKTDGLMSYLIDFEIRLMLNNFMVFLNLTEGVKMLKQHVTSPEKDV